MSDLEAAKESLFARCLRASVGLSAAAGVLLAFAWPLAVSRDPADPAFKAIAIATLMVFLASLSALVVARARRLRRLAGTRV